MVLSIAVKGRSERRIGPSEKLTKPQPIKWGYTPYLTEMVLPLDPWLSLSLEMGSWWHNFVSTTFLMPDSHFRFVLEFEYILKCLKLTNKPDIHNFIYFQNYEEAERQIIIINLVSTHSLSLNLKIDRKIDF